MDWYLKCLRQYAEFSGRARREEYWMFVLFNTIFAILAVILDNIIGTASPGSVYGVLFLLYSIATFIPGLAVLVRRLHDTGRSEWMWLISFIPIIGAIWLLVILVTDGDPEANQYGSNPKKFSV